MFESSINIEYLIKIFHCLALAGNTEEDQVIGDDKVGQCCRLM